MKRLLPAWIVVLLLLLPCAEARANRYVTYVVRPTDTIESIAGQYYGNRARALFITEFNGLPRGAKLKAGQTIKIPTSYRYKLAQNETLADVAGRLVGDRRRGPLLAQLSDLRPGTQVGPGTEIQVPFHFAHLIRPGETLGGIARTYYGDPGQARLLAAYNFNQGGALRAGERLVVPITHVRVRSVRLIASKPRPKPARVADAPAQAVKAPVQAARPAPVAGAPEPEGRDAEKAEAELAAYVSGRVKDAERAYQEGNYTEVPAALVRLLTEVDPSEAQLVEIYRLLACAYVALGETELAVKSLREVLDRQPDFRFDPVQTSPKIRAALERARR
jgi:LysM repeat protein